MNNEQTQTEKVAERATALFEEHRNAVFRQTDRLFARLMLGQWVFGILVALFVSPYAWQGRQSTLHLHVYVAVLLGGLISALPIALVRLAPGSVMTRNVIAVAQMLWSALLIHLSGGRIETHFHVFGSLAFMAFYRDWRVLVPASLTVVADHVLRGLFWPESVYGVANPEWWRFFEHAFWVVFIDFFLVLSCVRGVQEMELIALRRAQAEVLAESPHRSPVAA
jgi:hypothetical protein